MTNVNRVRQQGHGDVIDCFLAVANPEVRPTEFLNWIRSLPAAKADVRWPMQHERRRRPWEPAAARDDACRPLYGQWFADLFDAWWLLDEPGITIPLFSSLVELALGGQLPGDTLVSNCCNTFVVNTDGDYEYPDCLRASADDAVRAPLDAHTPGMDPLVIDPLFARLLNLREQFPAMRAEKRHETPRGDMPLSSRNGPVHGPHACEACRHAEQAYFFGHAFQTIQQTLQQRSLQAPSRARKPAQAIAVNHEA